MKPRDFKVGSMVRLTKIGAHQVSLVSGTTIGPVLDNHSSTYIGVKVPAGHRYPFIVTEIELLEIASRELI
jgi:hypothetical protein